MEVAENIDIKALKREMRRAIKRQFASHSAEFIERNAADVLERLKKIGSYSDAEVVLAFVSMNDEIPTRSILEDALASGKKLALPKVEGSDLAFYLIENLERDLAAGAFGIEEPAGDLVRLDVKSMPQNAVILVPGLAFDSRSCRLGRGKGFYDRFFGTISDRIVKIGICCSFQMVECVPREAHDKALDMVVCGRSQ